MLTNKNKEWEYALLDKVLFHNEEIKMMWIGSGIDTHTKGV